MLPNKAVGSVCAFGYSIQVILSYDTSPEAEKISEECIESLYSKRARGMPPLAAESGLVSRIVSQREVMISIAGLALVLLTLLLGRGSAAVLLLNANDESRSFPDMEASFAPRVPASGVPGILYAASPLDACSPLLNYVHHTGPLAPFVLISRGICNFDIKVRNAQDAGFAAAIVFNSVDFIDELVTMSGISDSIEIYAVFVSWLSGQALLSVVGDKNTTCIIQPAFENTAWSIMAVSFISLLAVSAVLATFFFVRRHRLRHFGSRLLSREPSGMSAREVQALPTFVFKGPGDGNGTAETCAICLEDYESGEKLRLLPCHHEFHVGCIDQWLLTRRPFCPVCKRDANTDFSDPAATETTPLLVAAAGRALSVPVTSSATQTSPVGSPTNQTTQSLPSDSFAGSHNTQRGGDLV